MGLPLPTPVVRALQKLKQVDSIEFEFGSFVESLPSLLKIFSRNRPITFIRAEVDVYPVLPAHIPTAEFTVATKRRYKDGTRSAPDLPTTEEHTTALVEGLATLLVQSSGALRVLDFETVSHNMGIFVVEVHPAWFEMLFHEMERINGALIIFPQLERIDLWLGDLNVWALWNLLKSSTFLSHLGIYHAPNKVLRPPALTLPSLKTLCVLSFPFFCLRAFTN